MGQLGKGCHSGIVVPEVVSRTLDPLIAAINFETIEFRRQVYRTDTLIC